MTDIEKQWKVIEDNAKAKHWLIKSLDLLVFTIKEEELKEKPNLVRIKNMVLALLSAVEK